MITPQQIDQISFRQARHGYDMEQVDKILEPLNEDYVALYKENALLKSKMRVLVGKLEEYRKNEAAAKDALDSAKRSAEQMMQEAEAKCAQMMRQAQKMQAQLAKAQDEIKDMTAEATAGGGMVKVVAKGDMTLVSVTIDPEAVDPEDVEMLQDVVLAAANAALAAVSAKANARLSAATGGMNIPGLM